MLLLHKWKTIWWNLCFLFYIFSQKKINLLACASFFLANTYKQTARHRPAEQDSVAVNKKNMNNSAMEILYLKTWMHSSKKKKKCITNCGAEDNHMELLHTQLFLIMQIYRFLRKNKKKNQIKDLWKFEAFICQVLV